MGMESFFIMLLPEGIEEEKDQFGIRKYVGDSKINKESYDDFLNQQLEVKDNIYKEFVVIKKTIDDNKKIQQVSLECCFYHYSEGLKYIIEFWDSIKEKLPLRLFHPAIGFISNSNTDEFIKKIKDFYNSKYQAFVEEFGEDSNGNIVLPNEGFTKYLESIGRIK